MPENIPHLGDILYLWRSKDHFLCNNLIYNNIIAYFFVIFTGLKKYFADIQQIKVGYNFASRHQVFAAMHEKSLKNTLKTDPE
jgi:hypothetical protein